MCSRCRRLAARFDGRHGLGLRCSVCGYTARTSHQTGCTLISIGCGEITASANEPLKLREAVGLQSHCVCDSDLCTLWPVRLLETHPLSVFQPGSLEVYLELQDTPLGTMFGPVSILVEGYPPTHPSTLLTVSLDWLSVIGIVSGDLSIEMARAKLKATGGFAAVDAAEFLFRTCDAKARSMTHRTQR